MSEPYKNFAAEWQEFWDALVPCVEGGSPGPTQKAVMRLAYYSGALTMFGRMRQFASSIDVAGPPRLEEIEEAANNTMRLGQEVESYLRTFADKLRERESGSAHQ